VNPEEGYLSGRTGLEDDPKEGDSEVEQTTKRNLSGGWIPSGRSDNKRTLRKEAVQVEKLKM
jgi:hypothetical protein